MSANNIISFLVGSYTHGEGASSDIRGEGITSWKLDRSNGAMEKVSELRDIVNPSYLSRAIDDPDSILFVGEEVSRGGAVGILRQSPDGRPRIIDWISTEGLANCHVLGVDAKVIVASYKSGSITWAARSKDKISRELGGFAYEGSSVNKARQEAPHAHHAAASPDGKFIYICDLGSDRVWRHALSADAVSSGAPACATPPGSGPRHLVFHPHLPLCYITCELTNEILIMGFEASSGDLQLIRRVPGLSKTPPEGTSGAAIRIHPRGHTLYASFRGADVVSAFRIDESGGLDPIGETSTLGSGPRDFNLSPDGDWMVVANQNTHDLRAFPVDSDSGIIGEAATRADCGSPVCVLF